MKYPIWKPLLIVLVVMVSALMIYPPERKLKPGLDLAGGTTLTYDVRLPEDASDPQGTISSLIDVLAQRVDPTGTRNLVWRQVAGNRIEVSMALASPQAKRLGEEYQAALAALLDQNLPAGQLRSALRLAGEDRDAELRALADGDEARLERLRALAAAQDRMTAAGGYREAQQALSAAEAELSRLPADAGDEQRAEIQSRIASLRDRVIAGATEYRQARQAYEALETELLATNIDPSELDQALKRPVEPKRRGEITRGAAMASLIESHPAREQGIREVFDAYAQYDRVKGPLDDPNDLIALLRGSGVLEFRIAAVPQQLTDAADYVRQLEERGPRAGMSRPWRWFAVDDLDQFVDTNAQRRALEEDPEAYFASRGLIGSRFGEDYYVLLANTADAMMTRDQNWELASAGRGFDSLGRNAVNFALNAPGGDLMGAITGANVGRPMAILLDNKVMSAPNLQSQIRGSGQITGSFSAQELDYLLRTLRAGSSEAELGEYPISIKTTGPALGQDNLNRGVQAAVIALALTAAFMTTYYFVPGFAAVIGLLVNMIVLLGVMAMFGATFTLPGIAGIVLTIGMAVDANVLVYERIREEILRKADLITAIRLGYEKALSSILDSNITTFITCVVLYYTATADIKGFAITLMVGIVATLFASLFVSRVVLELYVTYLKPRTLSMLPLAVPAVHRAFSPNVDWMSKKWAFFAISAVVSIAGISMVIARGGEMLDVEFRSGTQVSFTLADDQTLPLSEARERLRRYASVAQAIGRGDTANLSPEEQAVLPEVQRLVREAEARHAQWREQATRDAAEGRSVDAEPQPVDFGHLATATVVTEGDTDGARANGFAVATLIQDAVAVSDAVKSAFGDLISVTRPIGFAGMDQAINTTDAVYPITTAALADVLRRPDVEVDTGEFVGGVAIVLQDLTPPTTLDDIHGRVQRIRNQPGYEDLGYRPFEVVGLDRATADTADTAEPAYRSVAVLVRDAETNYAETTEGLREPGGLAATEWALVRDALQRDTSLASVSNFSSQVSKTMQQQAVAAILLSVAAIMVYVWFRFGGIQYSVAAILALVHDVTVVIGLLAISGWVYDTALGQYLMLHDFKINLAIVAAILTIIGYSLNDTIVIFDRIRENRGRLAVATSQIINDAVNQTISRTVITGFTTVFAVLTLYIIGGSAIQGFAFAMFIGVLVGTYSSIAIASPAVELLSRFARRSDARGTLHTPTVTESNTAATQG